VNLLSHYYLEQHQSAYHKLGALMPDLIYRFNHKLRREIFSHGMPEGEEHRQIFSGIKQHYAVDVWFHGSEFFSHYSRLIHGRMKELPLPNVSHRSYFLAHVFLELMLDRLLAEQYPYLCVEMYVDLESVNPEAVVSYFSRVGKTGVFSEFLNNFSRLLDARHLPWLSDNEMFVKALFRTYRRINPANPSREEAHILMELTEQIETEYRHNLLGIFEMMRSHPANA
jgi:hypothetical protein